MSRIRTVVGMIVGAFCIYCGQSAINEYDSEHDGGSHARDGSFVKDAAGQSGTCCAPPARKVIVDDEIQLTRDANSVICLSPEWDIGSYQRIVVHADNLDTVHIEQKHGIAGFVHDVYNPTMGSVQLDPFNGTTMRLRIQTQTSSTPCRKMKVTIVGAGA